MTDKVRVYRMDVVVIDHDGLGPDGARRILEDERYPNHCMSPKVVALDERVVQWSDDHPLNKTEGQREALEALFKTPDTEDCCAEATAGETKLASALVQIVDQCARGSHGPTLMQLLQATSVLREVSPRLDEELRGHIQQVFEVLQKAVQDV